MSTYIGPALPEEPTEGLHGAITVGGNINLNATSINNASIDDIGLSINGVSVEQLKPEITAAGATRAYVGGDFTLNAGGVAANATSTTTARSNSFSIEISGVAVEIPSKSVKTNHSTEAFVGRQGDIEINGGGLTLNATSNNNAELNQTDAIRLGAVDISKVESTVDAGGSTSAYIDEGSTIDANSLSITANATNYCQRGYLQLCDFARSE